MKFYFSGINNLETLQMLDAALVENILVDHKDAASLPPERRINMLDSGAYRAYKAGTTVSLPAYLENVKKLHERCDLIIAPDVVGKPCDTLENYQTVKDLPELKNKLVPVWQWNTSFEHLIYYLGNSKIVGIGGLSRIFHENESDHAESLREETIKNLVLLCTKFPDRFHLFGLNDLKALEILKPFAYSADSAFWITRAGKGLIIFQNTKTHRLTQAPYHKIPQYNRFDRKQRAIENATNIDTFLSRKVFL